MAEQTNKEMRSSLEAAQSNLDAKQSNAEIEKLSVTIAELEETVRRLEEAEKAAAAEKLETSDPTVAAQNGADKNDADEEHKSGGFGRILKTAYWALTTVALFSLFVAATFAWFSSNSIVNTDKVTGNTSTDTVELLISSTGVGNFQPGKEANLVQVNASSSELLMPVSTSDLITFVTSPGMVDGKATYFEKIQGEKNYYHGRVYLQAAAQGHSENAKLALYLDSSASAGGSLITATKGYITRAARLGLTFDGSNARIMRLSEESNPSNEQAMNAVVGGVAVQAGQVINGSANPMQIVADPSVPIAQHMVGEDGLTGSTTISPLLMMDLNRIYAVDVYFYLEGCDPDCSEAARLDSLNLHLAFYGVLMEEAN